MTVKPKGKWMVHRMALRMEKMKASQLVVSTVDSMVKSMAIQREIGKAEQMGDATADKWVDEKGLQ